MGRVLLTAAVSFAGTAIDNFCFLLLFFSLAKERRDEIGIVCGEVLGILLLAGLSFAGALGARQLPPAWLGMLGFLPLFLGFVALLPQKRKVSHPMSVSFLAVFLTVVAGGGDNIGVWLPVIAGYTVPQALVMLVVFLLLCLLLCLCGRLLAKWAVVRAVVESCRRWLVPAVFIGLGCYILWGHYGQWLHMAFWEKL